MRAFVLAACALLLLPIHAHAESRAVRLHWRPSPDPGVRGYRLYARAADAEYGPPVDVGLPRATRKGILRFELDGLDLETAYAFAVTAYRADGHESGLSNELALGACAHVLDVGRFELRGVRRRWRLAADAAVDAPGLGTRFTGVALSLLRADGRPLYSVTTRRRAFRRVGRDHAVFRLRPAARAKGLRHLVVSMGPERIGLAVRATVHGAGVCEGAPLTWIIRVRDACVFAAHLACSR